MNLNHRELVGKWLNEHVLVGDGVEVGCAEGNFAASILSGWNGKRLFMVDPWEKQSPELYPQAHAEVDFDALYQCCANLAQRDNRATLIRKTSIQASGDFENWSLDFCLPAESPIWMNDFTFKPVFAIKPGDAVIGWRKELGTRGKRGIQHNWLCPAIVSGVTELTPTPIVKLTLQSGRTIRCTPNHLWLNNNCLSGKKSWCTAAVGNKLCLAVDIPTQIPVDLLRTAAWLGGVYDGEGCRTFITQDQKRNPRVYAEIGRALAALGFMFRGVPRGYYILGGRSENTRFVNWCQPVRWDHRPTSTNPWIRGACHFAHDQIVSIDSDGCEPVHALTTSTGNYVAWGFASKNCYIDAAHDYANVYQDLEIWYPKVKPGGLFGGHDFNHPNAPEAHNGVMQAVTQWMHERGLNFTVTRCTSWWTIKRNYDH